jgi:hypothetical protein
MQLRYPEPPRLPDAPDVPTGRYVAGLLNALRLFFNQLNNVFTNLLGPNGGQYLSRPNGLFYNTTTQTLAAPNVGYPITFDAPYLSNGVRVISGSRITADIGGVYNFQYRGCVESGSASSKNVFLWISRGGTAVGFSTTAYTLVGSGTLGVISWNFNIDLQAGQYVELYWAADSTDVELATEPAAGAHPGIAASVVAVDFVSPLPTDLPTLP